MGQLRILPSDCLAEPMALRRACPACAAAVRSPMAATRATSPQHPASGCGPVDLARHSTRPWFCLHSCFHRRLRPRCLTASVPGLERGQQQLRVAAGLRRGHRRVRAAHLKSQVPAAQEPLCPPAQRRCPPRSRPTSTLLGLLLLLPHHSAAVHVLAHHGPKQFDKSQCSLRCREV